ncbi:unnamed protein product [Blepharisma stoltei]|uniref:Kinesin motor domain-containing protein n=1 Tax=Blepharisma stoltei TaxID=1481888 RepID=A0AAU9JHV4_9CILI|nr:unnamed protein product [Blepharisma stoltei]
MAGVNRVSLVLRFKNSNNKKTDTSLFKISPTNTEINIITPPNLRHTYPFQKIYTNDNNLKEFNRDFTIPMMDHVVCGGNCTITAIGAPNTGKSYSLFGVKTEAGYHGGIVIEGMRHLIDETKKLSTDITIGILVSFFEMHNGKIRDLGIAYQKREEWGFDEIFEFYKDLDLPVKETNLKSYIEGISLIQVNSLEEVEEVIWHGFQLRESYEKAYGPISDKCITVLSATVSQRSRAFTTFETKNGRFHFVDTSGSECNSVQDESDLEDPNNMLKGIKKVFNKLNMLKQGIPMSVISYKTCKLTHYLQSGLTGNSLVTVLHTIDSEPSKFNEAYKMLEFSKSIVEMDARLKVMRKHVNSTQEDDDNIVIRLREEIRDIDKTIETAMKYHEEKIKKIAKFIGIDEDMEILLNSSENSKEYETAKKFKEAPEIMENLINRNKILEEKIKEGQKLIGIKREKLEHKRQALSLETKKYDAEIIKAKKELEDLSEAYENRTDFKIIAAEEMDQLLINSHLSIEEMSANLHSIKSNMMNSKGDLRNLADMVEIGRNEDEHIFKKKYMEIESQQKQKIENLIDQFKYYDKILYEKNKKFERECKAYSVEINETLKQYKEESVQLYEIAVKLDMIINEIESGKYNMGVKPVLIPRTHKFALPRKEDYPITFRAIGATPTILRDPFSSFSQSRSIKSSTFLSSATSTLSFNFQPKLPKVQTFRNFEDLITEKIDLSTALSCPLKPLNNKELKNLGTNLQMYVQKKTAELESINSELDSKGCSLEKIEKLEQELKNVQEEAENFKTKYEKEVRSRIDLQDHFYYSPRPESRFFITEMKNSRPVTQHKMKVRIPQTAKNSVSAYSLNSRAQTSGFLSQTSSSSQTLVRFSPRGSMKNILGDLKGYTK